MKECLYCKKSYRHDSQCYEKDSSNPCLIFDRDPRGKQLYLKNVRLDLEFGTVIPQLGKPDNNWTMHGIDKTITVNYFRKVEWKSNAKGLHGIYVWADIMYWSDENGVILEKTKRPRLVLCR